MEEKISIHLSVLVIVTIACLGLVVESISEKWEFWVPPLLFAGMILIWMMHLTQYENARFRENAYLVYAMMGAFFHGVHESSFFDVVVIAVLMMTTFSFFNRKRLMNMLITEYIVIMILQFVLAIRNKSMEFNSLEISRVVLHFVVAFAVFFVCKKTIDLKLQLMKTVEGKDEAMKEAGNDMEDFLTNISHELRTPVNVVNGMSALMIKNEYREDVAAIKEAGLKLSCQIEDIQDYTELKRNDVVISKEKYMITSLINDIISSFDLNDRSNEIEVVIDLDPGVPTTMIGDVRILYKVLKHLIENALRYTNEGGVYIRIMAKKREYGVNLCIEVTDTGIGMSRKDIANVNKGLYQANKKRNRSTGGIGLGLYIVYGFVHLMNGFALIESEKGKGTTVRLSIPQEVADSSYCLSIDHSKVKNVIFHVDPGKYKVLEVREFYRKMAVNIAAGLRVNLYSAVTVKEIERITSKLFVSHLFMGEEEYKADPAFFDELSKNGTIVAVSAFPGFETSQDSKVVIMPKPLYGFPVTKILNDGQRLFGSVSASDERRPYYNGVKTLIVDDEPMNLVVATGLINSYGMTTDTAESGMEAIEKYANGEYDLIFMDHMMPKMDGVEAMKKLKEIAKDQKKNITIIALTANALSGAREMLMNEGFDAFLSKPVDIKEFERIMKKVLPESMISYERGEEL